MEGDYVYYKVYSLIDKKSISDLKKLKNTICTIQVDDLGTSKIIGEIENTMGLIIRITSENSDYIVKNTPELKDDGEESPSIVVTQSNVQDINKNIWIKLLENKTLESLSIVTDCLIWNNDKNTWELKIDVGIKMVFKGGLSILIMAKNSSVGLFEIWTSQKQDEVDKTIISISNEKIVEFWGFEPRLDSFKKIKRFKTTIF